MTVLSDTKTIRAIKSVLRIEPLTLFEISQRTKINGYDVNCAVSELHRLKVIEPIWSGPATRKWKLL